MTQPLLPPDLINLDLENFMREALLEAEAAGQAGELPIGAVVVLDNEIISRVEPLIKGRKASLGTLN